MLEDYFKLLFLIHRCLVQYLNFILKLTAMKWLLFLIVIPSDRTLIWALFSSFFYYFSSVVLGLLALNLQGKKSGFPVRQMVLPTDWASFFSQLLILSLYIKWITPKVSHNFRRDHRGSTNWRNRSVLHRNRKRWCP